MVHSCSVRGCRRTRKSDSGLKLYTFPKNEKYRAVWVAFCDSRRAIPKTGAICSVHFEERYRYKNPIDVTYGLSPKRTRDLTANAIPTLNGPLVVLQIKTEVETEEHIEPVSESRSPPEEPMDTDCPVLSSDIVHEPSPMRDVIDGGSSSCQSSEAQNEAHRPEWYLPEEKNEDPSSEKVMIQMNAEKLKVSVQAVVEENTNLRKRNEKLEKERQEIQRLLKLLEQQQHAMRKEKERLVSELNNSKVENQKYEAILNQLLGPGQLRQLLSDNSNRR